MLMHLSIRLELVFLLYPSSQSLRRRLRKTLARVHSESCPKQRITLWEQTDTSVGRQLASPCGDTFVAEAAREWEEAPWETREKWTITSG